MDALLFRESFSVIKLHHGHVIITKSKKFWVHTLILIDLSWISTNYNVLVSAVIF